MRACGRTRKRAAEADVRVKRLYETIESGVADLSSPALKERITELEATRDQAQVDAERAIIAWKRSGRRSHARLAPRLC